MTSLKIFNDLAPSHLSIFISCPCILLSKLHPYEILVVPGTLDQGVPHSDHLSQFLVQRLFSLTDYIFHEGWNHISVFHY